MCSCENLPLAVKVVGSEARNRHKTIVAKLLLCSVYLFFISLVGCLLTFDSHGSRHQCHRNPLRRPLSRPRRMVVISPSRASFRIRRSGRRKREVEDHKPYCECEDADEKYVAPKISKAYGLSWWLLRRERARVERKRPELTRYSSTSDRHQHTRDSLLAGIRIKGAKDCCK